MAIVSIRNLVKSYGRGEEKQAIFDGLSLDISHNSFVSILGRSGSGKTTLLNTISTLDQFDSGQVYIDGYDVKRLSAKALNRLRNRYIGFVFQDFNLIDDLSILDNVALPLVINNVTLKEARKKAAKALQMVELHQFIKLKPVELSGGQKQRVAIARAIVNDQKIILCDEPTGALDDYTSESILDLLKKLTVDKTVIMVTHDEEYAKRYSDRIIVLSDGDILYDSNEGKVINTVEEENVEVENTRVERFKFYNVLRLSQTSFNLNYKKLNKSMGTIINAMIIFLIAEFLIFNLNRFLGVYFLTFSNSPVMSTFLRSRDIKEETLSNALVYGMIYTFIFIGFISFIFILNMVLHEKRKESAVMKAFGANDSMIRSVLVIKVILYSLRVFKTFILRIFIILMIVNSLQALPYILQAEYGLFLSHIWQTFTTIIANSAKNTAPGVLSVNLVRMFMMYILIVVILVIESLLSMVFMSRENTIRVLARE